MSRSAENSSRRRPEPPRTNPALVPGLIALVLIAIAVVVAVLNKKPAVDPAASAPRTNPFADVPDEAPPPPREHKPGSNLPMAPDSVVSEPAWLEAQKLAGEARKLYDAAVAAKAANDLSLAREKGVAAREMYDKAVESTAEWEEMLITQYNESDPKLRAIRETRSDWFAKMNWLKKSVGH